VTVLLLDYLLDWWWADPVAGLVIVIDAIREAVLISGTAQKPLKLRVLLGIFGGLLSLRRIGVVRHLLDETCERLRRRKGVKPRCDQFH
jgi:hypothetical protein